MNFLYDKYLSDDSFESQTCILECIYKYIHIYLKHGFPGDTLVKNLPASAGDAGDTGSILGSERSLGGGHGNPWKFSCRENPIDSGSWWATVHGVTKRHDWKTEHIHMHRSKVL